MKTLVIIYGQIRTLSHCIRSILDNIIIPNKPCHVALAIDGEYHEIPMNVLEDLKYYLVDIYTTQNKIIERDNQRIEFSLVYHSLQRITDIDSYTYLLKIRTDLYVKNPIDIKMIYGTCSVPQFEKQFTRFVKKLNRDWKTEAAYIVKAWFLTGGLDFFIQKQLNQESPPRSPWSIKNIYQWTRPLFEKIDSIFERHEEPITLNFLRFLIRKLSENENIVYLIGSTWLHFGLREHIVDISNTLYKQHTNMCWLGKEDDDELKWIDHKGIIRKKSQKEWKLITDDQIRLVHHLYNYNLMDLVNNQDYIESFDATNKHNVNKKNPELFSWIVRKQSIHTE